MMKGLWVIWAVVALVLLSAGAAYGFQSAAVQKDIVYFCCPDKALTMDIYSPSQKEGLFPAIIYVHGGGWYSGDKTTGAGQDDIHSLVQKGYLVASIDYRLAPRYQFPAQIEDLKCAVRFLRANAALYKIDPAHIGVFGDSAGGHLAALLGTSEDCDWPDNSPITGCQSARVQAVVEMFGPVDLTRHFERERSLLIEHVFGTSDPESETIIRASPVTYVTNNDPPFLIIQGDKDEVVAPEQSEILFNKLISAGVPATLVSVSNSGHEFAPEGGTLSPSRSEITALLADFFGRYLK
jgi:acetyl esterase/lipase